MLIRPLNMTSHAAWYVGNEGEICSMCQLSWSHITSTCGRLSHLLIVPCPLISIYSQNSHHYIDNIFKCTPLKENFGISYQITLKCVLSFLITNKPKYVAWCHTGDTPLSIPMMRKFQDACMNRYLINIRASPYLPVFFVYHLRQNNTIYQDLDMFILYPRFFLSNQKWSTVAANIIWIVTKWQNNMDTMCGMCFYLYWFYEHCNSMVTMGVRDRRTVINPGSWLTERCLVNRIT